MTLSYSVYQGCIVYCSALDKLRVFPDGRLAVDNNSGTIIGVEECVSAESAQAVVSRWVGSEVPNDQVEVLRLKEGQFLMPGFVDTHTHAPQFSFIGLGNDLPLLDWLNCYTFPHESAFKDVATARRLYSAAVDYTIRNGTTCAAYYGTIHFDATLTLVDILRARGQRAFVGKVNMDQNSPDFYIESTEETLAATRRYIEAVEEGRPRGIYPDSPLDIVKPIITPRFAVACTMDCLVGLAEIAQERGLPIQSHLNENRSEVEFVRSLFPECESYADVYDKAGLMTERTIMAHCVHNTRAELDAMKARGVGISHCPNSNLTLASGMCDVRRLLMEGFKVGLGTDVSGGYSPTIMDSIRLAATTNRALIAEKKATAHVINDLDVTPLGVPELIYLATQGGADVVGLGSVIGSLVVGKQFDALLIDLDRKGSPVPHSDVTPSVKNEIDKVSRWLRRIEQFIYLGDDRNIAAVFVNGRRIYSLD